MTVIETPTDLAHIIQLAVAPVFLLAGIAGFLNVMSSRLGRIIDRARVVNRRISQLSDDVQLKTSQAEMESLWRRVSIIHWSIGLCTASALLVCLLIVGLFVVGTWTLNAGIFVGGLFVMALLVLIAALLLFMKEVQLATQTMRYGREFSDN